MSISNVCHLRHTHLTIPARLLQPLFAWPNWQKHLLLCIVRWDFHYQSEWSTRLRHYCAYILFQCCSLDTTLMQAFVFPTIVERLQNVPRISKNTSNSNNFWSKWKLVSFQTVRMLKQYSELDIRLPYTCTSDFHLHNRSSLGSEGIESNAGTTDPIRYVS